MCIPFQKSMSLVFAILSGVFSLLAQNIPPMIGDQVGKPKIRIPNPMERVSQQNGQSSQNQAILNQESELRSFLESYSACLSSKTIEKLAQYYWQGPELSVYWNSHEFHGWDSFGVQLQEILTSSEFLKFSLAESHIHLLGRFAWVASGYHLERTTQGKPENLQGQLTLILERKRNTWCIVHQHVSGVETF